ncbi:hypothetical protein [Agromyces arachidis]|uniref:hypothetical protein n=1 Tax=Agromyces arachidis TaxID=766966 RepID=UPI004056EAF0
MAVEGAVAVHPEETTEGLESLGVEPVEVRDPVGRNVVIAVIGLVVVLAALVPLVYGAVWAGSLLYAAVVSLLTGGPAAPPGTAI